MTSSLSFLPSGRSRPPMVSWVILDVVLRSSLSLLYSSLIIQSSNFFLGLLLPHLQSILPSIISLLSESPVIICPIQFRCLVLIIVNRDLSSSTSFNTSFDMCSVQLIFSILRYTFISKASNLVMSSFLIVLKYFCTVQGHTSNQCFHHSFLEASSFFSILPLVILSVGNLGSYPGSLDRATGEIVTESKVRRVFRGTDNRHSDFGSWGPSTSR